MTELVQQIQEEKDHSRFDELVEELNALLEGRALRFPPSQKNPTTHFRTLPEVLVLPKRRILVKSLLGLSLKQGVLS
jgi:hypothetical protein